LEILIPILNIFYWGLIIFCILSFIRMPQTMPIYDFLDKVYRPILDPIGKLLAPLQKNTPGLDFSPMVLIILLSFIMRSL
jgi:YggT family protein